MKKFVCGFVAVAVVLILFACVSSERRGIRNEELRIRNEQTQRDDVGEARSEVEVFPQLGHTQGINSVAYSADGKYIVSASLDNTIKLWDVETERIIRTFSEHDNFVLSVAFSPDGKNIISGSADNTIKLWSIESYNAIKTFTGHTGSVLSVAFSPDGKYILSGSDDNTLILWDIETVQKIRIYSGHTRGVNSVTFSPDGKYIFSGSFDNTIILWDMETEEINRKFPTNSLVNYVTFSRDGKYLLAGTKDNNLMLWDMETGQCLITFSGHTGTVNSVAFSPDGKHILSGSDDNTLIFWDMETGEMIRTLSGHTGSILSVAFSPDGKQTISGSSDNTIKLWNIEAGTTITTFSGHSWIDNVTISGNGKHILVSSNDKTLKLWEAETGRELTPYTGELWFAGHTDYVTSVAFSPDGKRIASSSMDSTVKLWEVETGRETITFTRHSGWVYTVVFSPDGKQVLSGSYDGTFWLWDAGTGNEIMIFSTIGAITSVVFSPDGQYILSGSSDGRIMLWEAKTGQMIQIFRDSNPINSVAFSPDGDTILSCSLGDTFFKLWDIETGKEIKSFSGHTKTVLSVTFNPDGKQVLSGSEDKTLKLWDVETGTVIQTFSGHSFWVNSVSFHPNGKQIVSSSYDGTVRLWDATTGKEIASFISFSGTDSQLTYNRRGDSAEAAEAVADISGEWICVTPDGYYAASPMGDRYLNVRVGNKVTGMDSFRHIFYNPDVVRARLAGEPDPVTKKTVSIQEAMSFFPSTVTLQTPAVTTTGTANLAVTVVDDNQPLQNIKILVNGRLVGRDELAGLTGAQGLVMERASITVTGDQKSFSFVIPLALDPGENLVEVIAFNGYAEIRQKTTLTWQTGGAHKPALPNLWILAVGVNSYDHAGTDSLRLSPELLPLTDLNFCANDAREIVNTFKALEGVRYAKVNALLLADSERESFEPTARNIRDNLSFLEQAGPRDVILLFLAGHGANGEDGMFYFLPKDARVNEDNSFSNMITGDEICLVLDSPGNRLVFIDACHAGKVDNERMVRQFMDTNAYVFASCRGDEFSHELNLYRHGVFTYSILETFRERRGAGILSVIDLSGSVSIDVPRRMRGRQNPVGYSLGFYDFIIGE